MSDNFLKFCQNFFDLVGNIQFDEHFPDLKLRGVTKVDLRQKSARNVVTFRGDFANFQMAASNRMRIIASYSTQRLIEG